MPIWKEINALNGYISISVKPYFPPESLGTYTVIEGEPKNISLRAFANPPEIDYMWKYPVGVTRSPRLVQHKHLLTIAEAKRTDSGEYTVTARNSYGDFATSVSFELDVTYPPAILSLTPTQTVEEGDVAEFVCAADGNPFTEETIRWDLPDRAGGLPLWENRREIIVDESAMTSTLRVHYAGREEAGRVVCSAGNGIRDLVRTRSSRLVVNHGPSIVKSRELSKYAVQRGNPAYLACRAVFVPNDAEFSWHMETDTRSKKVHPTDPNRGESVLETIHVWRRRSYIRRKEQKLVHLI